VFGIGPWRTVIHRCLVLVHGDLLYIGVWYWSMANCYA